MQRFLRDEFPNLILLSALVVIPAAAIRLADWTDGLEILLPIVITGLAISYLMAISRFSDLSALLATTVYGVSLVWVLAGWRFMSQSPTWRERFYEIGFRLGVWIEAVVEGGISQDNLIFVLLLGLLFWYLSFYAIWNLFRADRLWYATIPPGLALLLNNYYYFGPARLNWLLIAYLFIVFVLAVRTHALSREQLWMQNRIGFTPDARAGLVRAGIVGGMVILLAAFLIPTASANTNLATVWEQASEPWQRFRGNMDRLFNGVEASTSTTAEYYGGRSITLGGPVNLGDQPVMDVYAPQGYHYYWRSRVFDQYSEGRLTSTVDIRVRSDFGKLRQEEEAVYLLRQNVQQRFEILIPATQLMYAAPQVTSFASLPLTYDAIQTQPGEEYATVVSVRSNEVLTEGDSYGATSSISIADAPSLRFAGANYPAWIEETYLQIPDSITDRTYRLAGTIAAPHNNPYDIARAVEDYLRRNITYNERVSSPPDGAEPVDYVLFESQEGYCTYYATTMMILLRAQGIPARVAAGFALGTYDPISNAYRVLESDAHTWVEVYFPGYGWVEFEPTAAEIPIIRAETAVLPEQFATEMPLAEETPTIETAVDEAANAPAENQPDVIGESQGQETEASRSRRSGIPKLILSILAGAVGLALVGVIAWFWVEQRGLLKLSETARCYARLNIYASYMGIKLHDSATPYERASTLAEKIPEGESVIFRITRLYNEEQYGQPADPDNRDARARLAWQTARQIFLKRIAARFTPRH